jgi:hypothetical protein
MKDCGAGTAMSELAEMADSALRNALTPLLEQRERVRRFAELDNGQGATPLAVRDHELEPFDAPH